jgi:hypothetical protein
VNTRLLFETTLYSEEPEVALAVVSVPTEHLADQHLASSPANVLSALRLRPIAEVPPAYLVDALTAILATTDAQEAAQWLSEPPNSAPVDLGHDVEGLEVQWTHEDRLEAQPSPADERRSSRSSEGKRRLAGPPVIRRKVSKSDPEADELREFARDVAADAVVPFQRSPVDLFQLSDLLQIEEAARIFLATVRTNPIVLAWVGGGGFLVASALRGAGRGLSGGLQYRLLKLFGLPDDIVRDQMRRRRP